jgi:hypothetical protein
MGNDPFPQPITKGTVLTSAVSYCLYILFVIVSEPTLWLTAAAMNIKEASKQLQKTGTGDNDYPDGAVLA